MSLSQAFEADDGIIVGGVVLPESIVGVVRSSLPAFTGDLLTQIEYFNSLTQIEANRIAMSVFTYTAGELVDTQVNKYYDDDGTTVLYQENMQYNYSGDNLASVEVT